MHLQRGKPGHRLRMRSGVPSICREVGLVVRLVLFLHVVARINREDNVIVTLKPVELTKI